MKEPEPPRQSRAVVLDSAALIAGTENLFALGGLSDVETGNRITSVSPDHYVTFYTTPDVVQEVRDPRARARLAILQSSLVLRAPSSEALAAVVLASKQTGDYAILSKTDLKVMALCYMLEIEKNGRKHIREPKAAAFTELKRAPGISFEQLEQEEKERAEAVEKEAHDDDGWTTVETVKKPQPPKKSKKKKRKKKKSSNQSTSQETGVQTVVDDANSFEEPLDGQRADEEIAEKEIAALAGLDIKDPGDDADKFASQSEVPIVDSEQNVSNLDVVEDESDDGDWINEGNLEEHLAKDGGEKDLTEEDEQRVGCVTTDFAMQNTMLQMGLKLLSVDGRRAIREIKHFALRCHSCGHISRQLERKFCDKCGNATMHRVAFRVNKKGEARVFLNPKKKAILRGTKYPIPMPRGGRYNKDLILCEDQVDPVRQRRVEKQSASLNVDVLDPTNFYNAGARFNPYNRPMVVGYGRRNPNQVRPASRKKGK